MMNRMRIKNEQETIIDSRRGKDGAAHEDLITASQLDSTLPQ